MISLRVNKHFLASNENEESLKTREHGYSCKTKVRKKKSVTEMVKFNSPTYTVNPSREKKSVVLDAESASSFSRLASDFPLIA